MELEFDTDLWIYPGKAAWHFITVPTEYYEGIRQLSQINKKGFGSIRVEVTLGESTWKTSVFPDTKKKTYLLPIKKEIRKQNNVFDGDKLKISMRILAG